MTCEGTISRRELSLWVLFKPLNFQVSTFLLVDFFFFITDTSTDQTRTQSVSKQCHALKHSSISLAVTWPTSICCKIKYPFVTTDAEKELSKTSLNTDRPFLGQSHTHKPLKYVFRNQPKKRQPQFNIVTRTIAAGSF